MAIKEVLRIGHPVLQQIATAITVFDSPELHELVQDMMDTMAAENGAGLAAPQIGISQRVVIFGFEFNERYPDVEAIPLTVLVNPQIIITDDTLEPGWEGCLSIPAMRGLVPRYHAIRYQGFDAFGNLIDRQVSGFHARVVQHECDHLDGILYPQRIEDLTQFGYEQELMLRGKSHE